MRFNLEIRKIDGSIRIILPLFSRQPRSFGRIELVIDTGAPKTILSAGDAIRLNIPFTNFESATPLTGLGKGKTPVLLIKDFTFSLHNSDEKLSNLSMPILIADVPRIRNEGQEKLNNATRIPTLIGMDFLENNNFDLFIGLNKNIAYLEKVE
ncbi:hypothetical protein J4463_04215 [Candidatus Pacearchaeota archaeon]|nr:hypothetical protein [Candidatus Pacearchaeota archaeon]